MKFRKYSDGKYRATALIKDESGTEVEALFTTSIHPSEVTGWEKADVTTSSGKPVMVPKPEQVEVDVEEISVSKQSDLVAEKIKVTWV